MAAALAWIRTQAAAPATRAAGAVWLASKVALIVLAWAATWATQPGGTGGAPLAGAWEHWDARLFRLVAQYGYFGPPGKPVPNQAAFLPGYPLVLRATHLLIGSWTTAELAVAAVASFFAILGLIRLADDYSADDHPEGSGLAAAVFLIAAPAAVFLSVGYSEAMFLAFALPGWLAARHGRWPQAGLYTAAACLIRINGVFLLAGLVIMAAMSGSAAAGPTRSLGQAQTRRKPWPVLAGSLAIPLVPLAGYEIYLWHASGDWLAEVHAERAGWGRYFGNPVRTFTTTWHAAFGGEFHPPLAFMFQVELASVAVLVAVIAITAWRRQWPEAAYCVLTAAALVFGTWYESVPRALLLVFPLWCGLGAFARRQRAAAAAWLAASVPLMCVTALFYLSGAWAG
jgi:hypothetical protein